MNHSALRGHVFILLTSLLLAACSGGASPPSLEIPYTKYTLDNGLDVVLHEDHSDPIVALATLVHVGSSRERPGKTGFAHFFEHMSFNDSENVPRGANRKMIGELGGLRNGGTWTDGTIYFEVVPKDALEKLMWIDSDRLGFMINTVTEQALENEKQVVKNEKRQRVDNRPYGHTREIILEALYPEGHPYRWSVIGSLDDLQAATLEDVRGFYDRYYGPNNATLVVAGDIDIEETKALVEKWFGEIKRGPDVEPLAPRPTTLDRTQSFYHVDNFAKLPELRMTFPTVERFHPDSYALETLGSILSEGKRAQLYKTIVEEQKLAPEVVAYNNSNEMAGTFTIQVRATDGTDLDRVKAAIETALERFDGEGFLEKDLERIKAKRETDFYDGVSSVLDKTFQLCQYNEYAGDPGFFTEEIRRIQSVSREDVVDVFNRYIKERHYVLTSFVPKGGEELVVEGAERAEVVIEKVVAGAEKAVAADPNFTYERTETQLDRSEPPLGPPPVLEPPEIWTATTQGGQRVLGIEQDELPLFDLSVRFDGGHLYDPVGKAGLAALLGDLMLEGTRTRTPEELEDAIGTLGADLSFSASGEQLTLRARGLSRNYEAIVSLVEEIVLEPRWDEAEFERLKSAQLDRVRQRQGSPQALAVAAFYRVLYGDKHNLGLPTEGTLQTVSSLTLEDLKAYYDRHVSDGGSAYHVAGDVDRETVLDSLQAIGGPRERRNVLVPKSELPQPHTEPAVYFLDVPGSKQSVIFIGGLALDGADEDFNNLVYANTRLGAGSSARLFQLLRIEKGYTYGAGSRIPRRRTISPFMASSSVRANVTLESLKLFQEQLQGYAGTFTQDDLDATKNLLIKQATREFETLGDLVGLLSDISKFDLPLDFIEREQRELMELTLEDVRGTIAKYMNESRMVYVVVGDGETQLERVASLGYGKPVLLESPY